MVENLVEYSIIQTDGGVNRVSDFVRCYSEKGSAIVQKITFKVQSFRRMPNPYVESTDESAQMYFALCDVTELPNNFPMKTNPREQNLKTSVAKKISASLQGEAEKDFFLLNRGILLSAKSVEYNNGKNELSILFEDEDIHGNVDGGHTYRIINEFNNKLTPGTQFVKIEILTGVESIFSELAAARNTSVQVQDKAIAELEKRFDILKEVFERESKIARRIAYTQNADGDIDISEILSILNMFNLLEYPSEQTEKLPIQSYSGKAKCTERYIALHKKMEETGENNQNPFIQMKPIMLDIFKLYNKIETNIGEYYSQSTPNGRYGMVKGVISGKNRSKKFSSKFYKQEMEYSTPTGFIYPILGAFRALVGIDKDSSYYWRNDPFAALDKLGGELVSTTVDRSRSLGNNPQSVGKDIGNWRTLYYCVDRYRMRLLEKAASI